MRQRAKTEKANIRPEDRNGSDQGVSIVSDGGLAHPAFPLDDEIAPSVSSVSKSSLIATHSCAHSDPHSCAHITPQACKKSLAAQFIESAGNDYLKIRKKKH